MNKSGGRGPKAMRNLKCRQQKWRIFKVSGILFIHPTLVINYHFALSGDNNNFFTVILRCPGLFVDFQSSNKSIGLLVDPDWQQQDQFEVSKLSWY